MFDKAVLSEYIRKNPCIGVEMPKEVKKERRVLTREEQEKFFTFASSYIHINVLKFAVTTGCRIGEVLGLKWEDCDFGKREITINKTIHYSKASSPVEGSKFFYTTAKTISSNRVIPMTDEVYEILQNQKIKQTEQKMWKRSIWKQHKEFQNLVFTCSDGSPVYYYNVNSAIKDYVAKINVIEIELAKEEKREPKILELFTCHTLRHTYATRCYENGVDQQVVQKLLGHSTLAMTTDLYTHVSEEKKKEEVAELKILAFLICTAYFCTIFISTRKCCFYAVFRYLSSDLLHFYSNFKPIFSVQLLLLFSFLLKRACINIVQK